MHCDIQLLQSMSHSLARGVEHLFPVDPAIFSSRRTCFGAVAQPEGDHGAHAPPQTFGKCFSPINLRSYVLLVCKQSLGDAIFVVP